MSLRAAPMSRSLTRPAGCSAPGRSRAPRAPRQELAECLRVAEAVLVHHPGDGAGDLGCGERRPAPPGERSSARRSSGSLGELVATRCPRRRWTGCPRRRSSSPPRSRGSTRAWGAGRLASAADRDDPTERGGPRRGGVAEVAGGGDDHDDLGAGVLSILADPVERGGDRQRRAGRDCVWAAEGQVERPGRRPSPRGPSRRPRRSRCPCRPPRSARYTAMSRRGATCATMPLTNVPWPAEKSSNPSRGSTSSRSTLASLPCGGRVVAGWCGLDGLQPAVGPRGDRRCRCRSRRPVPRRRCRRPRRGTPPKGARLAAGAGHPGCGT